MHNLKLMFFSLMLLALPVRGDVLTLTSLEWPPYAGRSLDSQGASVAVVKAAVEAMGHELTRRILPLGTSRSPCQESSQVRWLLS